MRTDAQMTDVAGLLHELAGACRDRMPNAKSLARRALDAVYANWGSTTKGDTWRVTRRPGFGTTIERTKPDGTQLAVRVVGGVRDFKTLDIEDPDVAARVAVADLCQGVLMGKIDLDKTARRAEGLAARFGAEQAEQPRFEHAPDFGWVRLDGDEYAFSGQAQAVVALLFNAARHGDGGIEIAKIGNKVGSNATRYRLEQSFRKDGSMHPAYAKLIEKVGANRARIRPDVVQIWCMDSPNVRQ